VIEEVVEEEVYEDEEEAVPAAAAASPVPAKAAKTKTSAAASTQTSVPTTSTNGITVQVPQEAIRVGVGLVTGFLGITFIVALARYVTKFRSAPAVRQRTVNRNLRLVQLLQEYLPAKRTELTPGVARGISGKVGFSRELVFR
jgi:hypothetical protein